MPDLKPIPVETLPVHCECPGQVTKDITATITATGREDDWQMAAESNARNAAADMEPAARAQATLQGDAWFNTIECGDGCAGKGCEKKRVIQILTVTYSDPKVAHERVVAYTKSIHKTFFTCSCDVTVTIAYMVYCICKH